MRIRTLLVVAALVAASFGVALGQQSAATPAPKTPTGLSFAFDAPHGQLTASGFALHLTPNTIPVQSVTGTIEVTITINLVSKFHKETWFPCAATVIGGEIDATNLVVEGGIETASGYATVSKSVATCKLTIPYEWTLVTDPAATEGLIVAFAAGAVGHEGNTLHTTVQLGGFDSLPANGATTKFSFDAAL